VVLSTYILEYDRVIHLYIYTVLELNQKLKGGHKSVEKNVRTRVIFKRLIEYGIPITRSVCINIFLFKKRVALFFFKKKLLASPPVTPYNPLSYFQFKHIFFFFNIPII